MNPYKKPYKKIDRLIEALQERAKELNCLYRIEEVLGDTKAGLDEICTNIIRAIPPGLQYPDFCQTKITVDDSLFTSPDSLFTSPGSLFTSPGFVETEWVLGADIVTYDMIVGTISVSYTRKMPKVDHGPFLREEKKLIETIADRLGHFIIHQKMKQVVGGLESARRDISTTEGGECAAVLEMLKETDRNLFLKIARKMLNHLCWSGVAEAEELLCSFEPGHVELDNEERLKDWNVPNPRQALGFSADFSSAVFRIAHTRFPNREILGFIQKWIHEDKLSFLGRVVNRKLSLGEVADAIRRYHHLNPDEREPISASKRGIDVALIRRFLGDQLEFINVAKNFIEARDFYYLLKNVIFSAESHGKLGGKSSGLYLAAQILKEKGKDSELLANVKTPKTWYITSDVVLDFIHYNNLDEVVEQKYKEINQIRLEYPNITQTFKNGRFPEDIINGLSRALDDFGDSPLIVRSSSLLEDRMGAAFSGKYKSLFLANQGSKEKRLDALTDAIAEVYASVFGSDPIEYRIERGLIDFGEEMGIMIQEVVGTRMGRYFLPSWAGVAFSNNEFRWSPRIKREDGLIRIVPGLGTRAVDRLSDDYPILIAPGRPGLRVNITVDETVRYSPRKIDVINLETNSFDTIELDRFLEEVGYELPGINRIVSICDDDLIRKPMGLGFDLDSGKLVATFEGLIADTPFVKQMRAILDTLEESIGTPVDIEFASDGKDFYLLQCRPQSDSDQSKPAAIPRDIPEDKILFSANRYISNGRVPDITHIVYVDPKHYSELGDRSEMVAVGRAVGKLNKLLPKRQFILMGPGRWGSRGDIKLGVNVTYSDINNTAVLIEIAFKKGSYLPDLSFGTHFFQDLVEANIRYLPLYPDDSGIVFNERFFAGARNLLPEVLPEFALLSDVVRLIDVSSDADGKILRVLMNADLDEAVGVLADPSTDIEDPDITVEPSRPRQDKFWRWRIQMAERIAAQLDADLFGVQGFYIFGSAKNATAGPESDIDVLIHVRGTAAQLDRLKVWLDGWSRCLSEMNYMRTGYATDGLLDVHFLTDDDIARKTSYACKIGAVTDAARPLKMKKKGKGQPQAPA